MNTSQTKMLKAELKTLNRASAKLAALTEQALVTISKGKEVKAAVHEKITALETSVYNATESIGNVFSAPTAKAPAAPKAPAPFREDTSRSVLSGC